MTKEETTQSKENIKNRLIDIAGKVGATRVYLLGPFPEDKLFEDCYAWITLFLFGSSVRIDAYDNDDPWIRISRLLDQKPRFADIMVYTSHQNQFDESVSSGDLDAISGYIVSDGEVIYAS